MFRFHIRTCVLLLTLMYVLTLVLPFCVPSAEAWVPLPVGGTSDPPPPPPGGWDEADPDDVAINSSRGTGEGLAGGFGFGNEQVVIIGEASISTQQSMALQEGTVASFGRDSARWLLLVWVLASQVVTSF